MAQTLRRLDDESSVLSVRSGGGGEMLNILVPSPRGWLLCTHGQGPNLQIPTEMLPPEDTSVGNRLTGGKRGYDDCADGAHGTQWEADCDANGVTEEPCISLALAQRHR